MRHNYNEFNLLTTNRPEISHRILVSKSYSISNCSNYNSNPLKLYRSHSINNCSWTNIFHTILSSKY
uniref:Uncharacterized protein n=1 Tax=Marmota marmota marmota TaxID=9994 RepID=A0A8C5YQM2_MARMA